MGWRQECPLLQDNWQRARTKTTKQENKNTTIGKESLLPLRCRSSPIMSMSMPKLAPPPPGKALPSALGSALGSSGGTGDVSPATTCGNASSRADSDSALSPRACSPPSRSLAASLQAAAAEPGAEVRRSGAEASLRDDTLSCEHSRAFLEQACLDRSSLPCTHSLCCVKVWYGTQHKV